MNILLKAFCVSFVLFSLLFFTLFFARNFVQQQTTASLPSPQITPIPINFIGNGDADANNSIDFKDIEFISNNWNYSAGGAVDQYRDGKINSLDFAVTANQLTKQK